MYQGNVKDRNWLIKKYDEIAKKLLLLFGGDTRNFVVSCVNLKECSYFWESLRAKCDFYVEKVKKKVRTKVNTVRIQFTLFYMN